VAETLRASLPQGGVAGRFGGDEFWVLLPGHNRRTAAAYIEGVSKALSAKKLPLSTGGEAPPLTAGLATATFPADAANAEGLIAHVDKALVLTKSDRTRSLRAYVPESGMKLHWTPAAGHPSPSRMAVAGDFNGWDPLADPMIRGADGNWEIRLALAPGRYAYKFVRDGFAWEPDSKASDFVPDGYGGVNSLVHVKA